MHRSPLKEADGVWECPKFALRSSGRAAGIMLLDYFKGWRGWKYYALALVVLLAFQIGTTLAGIMIHR